MSKITCLCEYVKQRKKKWLEHEMAKILTQVTSIVHDIRIEKKKSKVQELFVVKWVE